MLPTNLSAPKKGCAFCRNHKTVTLPEINVPCPACSAPQQAADDMLVFECLSCGQRESLTPGEPCGACRGRELVRRGLALTPSKFWSYQAIEADRRAA